MANKKVEFNKIVDVTILQLENSITNNSEQIEPVRGARVLTKANDTRAHYVNQ